MKGCLVITGASRGLGKEIARRAREEGFKIVGLARNCGDFDAGEFLPCDVTNPASVEQAFRKLRDQPIYGLINAAGCASMNLHLTTPALTMERIVDCNLLGTMYCCAEGGRLLTRRKTGRIINFSSIAVPLGLAGESAYVGAKAGIEGFSRAFAREMAPFGVTVNVIAPGPVHTALTAGVPPDKLEALRKRQVIPRQLSASDIWDAVSLILDSRSHLLSGMVFPVGGA